MGCGGSSANSSSAPTNVEKDRRRLSVGHVDTSGVQQDTAKADEDSNRGLLTNLSAQTVVEMLDQTLGDGDRKFSIGSATDKGKTSFANKSIDQIGAEVDPSSCGLGYTCRKGLKPESPNQDSWSVLKVDGDFSIYGVYDGHGKEGHDVSNFVKENMPKLLIRDQRFKTDKMSDMCFDIFKKTQTLVAHSDRMKRMNAQLAGTTATIAIHSHAAQPGAPHGRLTIAHVADSTCVLGTWKDEKKTELQGKALTRDHKPDLKDEHARIVKAGGRVVFDGYANHRVYAKNGRYPGLNMSRCMGDLLGHSDAGCSCEPEVKEHVIDALDHILLLCSDGVWEFITPQEAVNIVGKYAPNKAMIAAEALAKESWDRWIQEEGGAVVDDITVVLVYLKQASGQA